MTSLTPPPDEISFRFGYRVTLKFEPEEPEQVNTEDVTSQYATPEPYRVDTGEETEEEPAQEAPYPKQSGKAPREPKLR